MENDPNANDPITDYSRTQRVVLLIDLNPLLHLQNPAKFLTSLLSSAKTLLSFSPLSSSLFAFKFFFSSLSPLLSSSKLRSFVPNSTPSLSFDRPAAAFESLSQALSSLPSSRDDNSPDDSSPRASCLAASMRQLVHDYAWDPVIRDPLTGTLMNCDPVVVRSNLVVLFSPVRVSLKSLSEFLDVGIDDDCLGNMSSFCEKFCEYFTNVNEAFVRRDIQFSWVNVRMDDDCEKVGTDESELRSGFLEGGIRNLGWGFCSSDSIVLGSALVPFGLIYPRIGISPNSFGCDDCFKKLHVQLCLQILDVAQKPLECKCCDLELVDLKFSPVNRSDNDVLCIPEIMNTRKGGNELKKKLWGSFGEGVSKIQVKARHGNDDFKKLKGHLSDPILVCEVSKKPRKDKKEGSDGYFADKALEMIAREWGDFVPRKSQPVWQILLSFLYRKGCWALVSLSNETGNSLLGILKPFTVSSALLFITNDEFYPSKIVPELDEADLAYFSTKTKDEHFQPNKHSDRVEKNSRRKRNLKLVEDQTWNSFCAAAFEHSVLELEDVYFARGCNNSKKLRFLKCWMKQIKKSSCCGIVLEEKSKPDQEIQKHIDDRLTDLCQESEQPISSASPEENSLTDTRIQDEVAADFQSETSETFFSNLSNKIQQGLESEAVDLGALAQRLVTSSIYWLNKKGDTETISANQRPVKESLDTTGGLLSAELLKLILRDPKDMIAKGRSNDPSSQASEGSEKIVREYELQILFRMEILQSEVGEHIGESMKQRFVRQICLLLETIQCHLEGGFVGDWSLDNYVGKIIKARYNNTLEDVVNKIYTKMDLLLFADEDELPDRLLNSEDSNRSLREKPAKEEMGENSRISEPISAEDESFQDLENDNGSTQGMTQDEHARKLIEAQERRERSRRFGSFTSWVPDLQRVWAPKQQKAMKPKSNPRRKSSKRKSLAEEINDTVCETPVTERRRSNSTYNYSGDDEDYQQNKDYSSQSCASVSKALFQDDQ